MKIKLSTIFVLLFGFVSMAQNKGFISLYIQSEVDKQPLKNITVMISQTQYTSDSNGLVRTELLSFGEYLIRINHELYNNYYKKIALNTSKLEIKIYLKPKAIQLNEVRVFDAKEETNGILHLKSVEGFSIYESKKTELIVLKDMNLNLATNNARQVFGKVAGLNIWESDQAGLQLGIGGRGLSPNRTSNFNTRQNGYDISADALGYPETYYTPPLEALDKIEIVRGAASLQYGTQFGGMVNFVFKKGNANKKIEVVTRQTAGSFGFLGTFNSLGGTILKGKLNYYTFFNRKQANGWRANSGFEVNTFYSSVIYQVNKKLSLNFDYTFMQYNAQQAGGLTDAQFEINPQKSFRNRNWFKVNWNLFSLTADYKLSDKTKINTRNFALLSQRFSLGNLERIFIADLGGDRTLIKGFFANLGNETRLLHQYSCFNKPHTFLIGTRWYYGTTKSLQGNGSSGKDANYTFNNPNDLEGSDYLFQNLNTSLFFENIFRINTKLTVTPGIRLEYINTSSSGFYKILSKDFAGNTIADTNIYGNEENVRSFLIAGIGMSFKPSMNTEIYANFSQNYRAVNFNDIRIVNPNAKIDANMKDESGFSADLGLRGNIKKIFHFDLTLFMLAYQNRIGQILKADLPPLYQDYRFRTNIADSRNWGFECFLELDMLKWIFKQKLKSSILVFTNFAYVNAIYTNSKDKSLENKKVEMAPPITLRSGITYKYKKLSATFQNNYVTEHFTDATNAIKVTGAVNGIIPTYQLSDFSVAYTFKNYTFEGTCNNLTNAMYFTRRADSYPGPGIIPSDARSFYITIGARF